MIRAQPTTEPHEDLGLPYADEDYSPELPSEADEAFYETVRILVLDLQHAANNDMVALSLSHALHTIRRNAGSRDHLFPSQHKAIRSALHDALWTADERLPESFDRHRLLDGIDGALALVDRWARRPEDRSQRLPCDRLADHYAHMKILENDCYSLSLSEGIAERAVKREAERQEWRAAVIEAMSEIDPARLPVINLSGAS